MIQQIRERNSVSIHTFVAPILLLIFLFLLAVNSKLGSFTSLEKGQEPKLTRYSMSTKASKTNQTLQKRPHHLGSRLALAVSYVNTYSGSHPFLLLGERVPSRSP